MQSFISEAKPKLPKMKWVEEENLHITIKFLGEVDPDRVERISKLSSEVSHGIARFDVTLGSPGAFPNAKRARVFWWGFLEGEEQCSAIFMRLEERLVREGFEPEGKSYHPHITLARLRFPEPLALESLSPPPGLSFTASSFELYESTLTPKGPIYRIIEEFKLG